MKSVFHLSDIEYQKNSVVTVGSFDGVHRAHQEILAQVVQRARSRKGRSVVLTFEPHPREVVGTKGDSLRLLTTLDERQKLFAQHGIDVVYVIKFDHDFSRLSSHEFYKNYIVEGIGVSEVIEGFDHHFGKDREGSVEELLKLGKEFGFSVVAVKPVHVGNEVVNSSKIRQLLLEGNVERAAEFLGRPYSLKGMIVAGDGRGKQLGYPTANLKLLSPKKLIPGNGIYFVRVEESGERRYGMASVGVRPTFHTNGTIVVEVNVLNFDGDLYGRELEVHFLKRLRDEIKFNSAEELVRQIDQDKEISLKLLQVFENK